MYNRVRMNIPSSDPVVHPEGVDGNIHTNGLALCSRLLLEPTCYLIHVLRCTIATTSVTVQSLREMVCRFPLVPVRVATRNDLRKAYTT